MTLPPQNRATLALVDADQRYATRKRRLLAIPLVGLLLIALLWVVVANRLSAERINSYRASQASASLLTSALEQHTIRAIHQIDQLTRFLAYAYRKSPARFDLNAVDREGVMYSNTIVQISIVGPDGRLLTSSIDAHPDPVDLSDREHIRYHITHANDDLFISKPVLGRVSKQWTVQLTRRLTDAQGNFAGVIVVSEEPAYFTNGFYNAAVLGTQGMIAVVSDDGTQISRRTGDTSTLTPEQLLQAHPYQKDQLHSGVFADPVDGIHRIVAYRHLERYPLGVMVGLSELDELADYRHTRDVYLLLSAGLSLAIALAVAGATLLIMRLLRRERDMTKLAMTDTLTGLPNRYHTLELLRHEVPERNGDQLALLMIDLDNFKSVNDTLGHRAADEVLAASAARLAQTTMDVAGDAAALTRVGGDSFLAVIKAPRAEALAVRLSEAIFHALVAPFEVHGSPIVLRASIGIALRATDDKSEVDLLKKVDLAVRSAKEAGRGAAQFYTPQMANRAHHRLRGELSLRRALALGQLFMVYQPKINLRTGRISGFEALVRWRHPTQGLIPPGEFVPLAESTGLIVELGNFVINASIKELVRWHQAGHTGLTLAVNISSMQFWHGDLLDLVQGVVEKNKIPPRALELEITETAMIESPELVSEKVSALKNLGVRVALDDFGTGYSSLSYLHRFSVDTLKIDRSFVQAVPEDRSVCSMISAIVGLAHSLGLEVVVEGVETQEQARWLATLGDIEAQGFLFSRPVMPDRVDALLARFGIVTAQGD